MLSSGRHTSRAGERCTRFIALHHPTLALLTMLVRFPHIFPANRLVLLFRLIFFAGSKALAEAKLIQPRPAPVIPTEWLTEEEVQPYLSSITRTINACICAAIKLSYGEDVKLCAQVIASLLSLAYACRLMGVTGLAFVTFILGFTLPKCYELKQPEVDAAYAKALAKAEELKRQSEDKVKLAMEYVRIPSAHDLARQEQEEEKKKL